MFMSCLELFLQNADRLTGIEVMSADNVLMAVDATVVWRIKNDDESLKLAASNAIMTQKSSARCVNAQ